MYIIYVVSLFRIYAIRVRSRNQCNDTYNDIIYVAHQHIAEHDDGQSIVNMCFLLFSTHYKKNGHQFLLYYSN